MIEKMIDLNAWFGLTGSIVAEPSLAPSDDLGSEDHSLSSEGTLTFGGHFGNEAISVLTFGTKSREQETLHGRKDQGIAGASRDEHRSALLEERLEEVHSVFADPTMWRYLDNFQIECLGTDTLRSMTVRRDDSWLWFESESVKENNVVMKVEASAISVYDIEAMQNGSDKKVPGSNAVGVVHHCSPSAEEAGIKPGMRVATILQPCGSNARYFSLPSSEILPVPRHLDAADIACVITNYLPAFQVLHHGRTRPYRYSQSCLQDRRVFIVGGDELVAQATIRLALLAGAEAVYICAPHFMRGDLQKHNVFVLDEEPSYWPEEIDKTMDVVIDYQFPQNFADVKATMAPKARLVCCTPANWSKETKWWSDTNQMFDCLQLSSLKRATFFDFRENYKKNRYELKEDLQFLLTSLTRRQIRPQIDRYVKLSDVPAVYQELKFKPTSGCIICEPWRE